MRGVAGTGGRQGPEGIVLPAESGDAPQPGASPMGAGDRLVTSTLWLNPQQGGDGYARVNLSHPKFPCW